MQRASIRAVFKMVSYVVELAKVFGKTYTCSYKNTTIGVPEKINFKVSYYLTSGCNTMILKYVII